MFRHVVFFKFRDDVREEAIEKASEMISGLKDQIDLIRSMELGRDTLQRPISYDLSLTLTFDNVDDYLAYDAHPMHLPVKTYNRAVCKEIAAVDYEV